MCAAAATSGTAAAGAEAGQSPGIDRRAAPLKPSRRLFHFRPQEPRAADLAAQIEANPAGAAEWFIHDEQSFSDEIDCTLRDEWIPDIYPKHPDARLPFESTSRSTRRYHASRAQRGEGPQSMTAEDISAYDRKILVRIEKAKAA